MIDLHTHTNASDGTRTPAALVALAREAGVTTLAVTDHDTVAGLARAARAAAAAGIGFVPGIEITAVWDGSDVHMLAYGIDPSSPRLQAFLGRQRADRERRARLIGERLAALGAPVDVERVIEDARPVTVSRPLIAAALIAAGHAADTRDAFDRYLGEGGRAYATRVGATPADVVRMIADDGGFTSMAHPAITGRDEIIPDLAAAGMTALEVYHSDHDAATVARYRALALDLGLAVTGGSDYHGTDDLPHRRLGGTPLPADDFVALCGRAGARARGRFRGVAVP
jgi:predicted metal-dependent phosphoesterase TrpH